MSKWISSVATNEAAPGSQPSVSEAAPGPHPCHEGNNSIEETTPPVRPGWKTAALARVGIRNFIERFGLDNCGFYTLTFPTVITPKEASAVWDSLNSNILLPRYGADVINPKTGRPGKRSIWIKATELQGQNAGFRPHYHVLLHVPGIRLECEIGRLGEATDVSGDWQKTQWVRDYLAQHRASKSGYYCVPGPVLTAEREFWLDLRERYGLGFLDIAPIYSTAERAAAYIAKYVLKSYCNRPRSLRGMRLIEYGSGCRPGSVRFSSIGGRAGLFREMVGMYCLKYGLEWDDLPTECEAHYGKPGRKYIGHRWAYFMRPDFQKVWDDFALTQPF